MSKEEDSSDNKVAVLTGASSGIGHATALEFASQGYNVVLTARRQNALREVAEECEKRGVRATIITADMTDESAVQKVAEAAVLAFGHFDIWVNAAAVAMFAKFDEAPSEDFRRVIETNLFGYVNGSREAIKQFKQQGHGTLINVSSVNATTPQPYTSAYVASKYAIRGLSDSLRMELELEGIADKIHICNAMPASVDTNLFQNAANYTKRQAVALEPVYDSSYVARRIAGLAVRPRREIIIGPAGKMMAMEHAAAPTLYEKMAAKFIDRNHLSKESSEDTSGNLYEPIQDNKGTSGGWRDTRLRADRLNIAIGAGVAAVGILSAGYLLTRKPK